MRGTCSQSLLSCFAYIITTTSHLSPVQQYRECLDDFQRQQSIHRGEEHDRKCIPHHLQAPCICCIEDGAFKTSAGRFGNGSGLLDRCLFLNATSPRSQECNIYGRYHTPPPRNDFVCQTIAGSLLAGPAPAPSMHTSACPGQRLPSSSPQLPLSPSWNPMQPRCCMPLASRDPLSVRHAWFRRGDCRFLRCSHSLGLPAPCPVTGPCTVHPCLQGGPGDQDPHSVQRGA